MKQFLLFISLLLIAILPAKAQQANIWYFGDHAGLNFNTTPPSALTNSQMYTHEGCATVSDSTGNLLFYTDGRNVWNHNHLVMPNGSGLMGHESSTHSAIVIPKPGSNSIYYIFTADAVENNGAGGYRYSELDMTLNGGLGNITANKNILLYAPSTEKLTAASHSNGIDIWVITKDIGNHTFRAYKVTCNGIDLNPVLSTVATISGNTLGYKTGCIKVSPDGTKIASARNLEGKWDLFKFDNATGIISDRILISQSNQIGIYGVEFSPNSQLVYLNGDYTYQYKVNIHDSSVVSNSKYRVDNVFIVHEALQIGPDGKIYSNTYPNSSVIANPDVYGVGCNYAQQAISLAGRSGFAGYPTFFGRLVTNYNVDYTYNSLPDCKTVNFSATSNVPGPLTWTWDFGDGNTGTGQNITHVFPSTPNQFTVTLTINNPNVCGGNAIRSKTVTFNRVAPTAKFGFTTSCNNLSVAFQDSSIIGAGAQIVSYSWDFGDGNTSSAQSPTHNYLNFGTYNVRLIVESNDQCNSKDTMIKVVNVAAKPVANFSFTNGCYTQPFQFNDISTIATGNITNWYWNFGDGNTSGLKNPIHTYLASGSYAVKLVVTSGFDCVSDTFTRIFVAGAKPAVNFVVPAICLLDATANFSNTTSVADTSTLNYLWNFDDPNATAANPNTSTLLNPTHQYSAAAVYNVKLITSTYLGCIDSITKPFTVNGAVPRANFIVSNPAALCSNMDVEIKDSSYVDFGNITKLIINWGDGNTTTDNNPGQMPNGNFYTHRYANFGSPAFKIYNIQMSSYSGIVCVDVRTKSITLHASPEILFNPIPEACNESIPVNIMASEIWGLTGSGTYSGVGIINPLTGTFNPALVTPGNYLITYSFITNFGCRADSARLITVNPTPQASFTNAHGCLPNAGIQFTSTSTVPGGNVISLNHVWNFGDPLAGPGNPNTSNAINPTHIYHSLNTFAVQLQTTSLKGCVRDTTINLYPNISIFPQPDADFKIDSLKPICAGSPVYFVNQSMDGGQAISQYYWSFGDGAISSAVNPNHVYNTHGNYPVKLWLQNAKGCFSDTALINTVVHSIPKANFSFDSTCFGKPVQFKDRSTNSLGAVSAWDWNMGNGNTSILQNPLATYSSYQPYTVALKVTTANGCASAPVSKTFSIKKVNIFAGRDTSIAKGQPLQLQAIGASNYTWTPTTGLNSNTIYNPIAVLYNNYQTYFVKGITTEGCLGFDTINIKVFNRADVYVPNAFTPNGDGFNDYLEPFYIGIKQLNYFRIYDRWGNIVFNTRNEFDKWNARLNGEIVPSGSFVWIAEAVTFDGTIIQQKGSVMVIR
jgi:gliding motility-associated-like protein